jgi:uncharacterized protein YdiU (UPF0061 family)
MIKLLRGKSVHERCAIVLRIAPSFLRFGSFEICNNLRMYGEGGPSLGLEKELIPKLANYLLDYHYKEIKANFTEENRYFELFKEIVNRTARMVALWQTVKSKIRLHI